MRLTKFLKRQVSKVLCAALVLSSVTVTGEIQEAEAASKTEIETNGTVLTLNETATGVLEEVDEQDWYIFDITERGYFSVDLQINDNADTDLIKYGWKYSLYHAEDWSNPISEIDSIQTNDEGKGRELPLDEGHYYICVDASSSYNGDKPVGCFYDVKVNFTESEDWEQEDNDSNTEPNDIEVNKTYYGNFHDYGDVDWYKVTMPGDGTIQLNFAPDASTNGDEIKYGWQISIVDAESNIIREYTTNTNLTPQVLPFEQGTFYIKVASESNYYGDQPLNCIYDLKLDFVEAQDWEKEYNNESAQANNITSGEECHGILSWYGDTDWYRIDNEEDVDAVLQFSVDESVNIDDIKYGWKVMVYNTAQGELLELEIEELDEIKKSITQEGIRMSKGTTYIKVVSNSEYYGDQPLDCIYHLIVTTTPVADSNPTPAPAGTPGNTNVPNSTDKPGNAGKPNNSTATTKPGTTNQSGGTSNEVMRKAITTSKVTTTTVTSKKKKSVYLRWKKQKYAGGYEIYRSTKKKNGYKKVKTIKGGSKVSWTDKKVKGRKTYYYKIRAYCKINGKKAVSGFSKVRRVKVKK